MKIYECVGLRAPNVISKKPDVVRVATSCAMAAFTLA